jgi:type VI protein secretion system component Hcp
MSEKKDTRSQSAEESPEDLELRDEEAEEVGGGAGSSDISITKSVDKSTPVLLPPIQ